MVFILSMMAKIRAQSSLVRMSFVRAALTCCANLVSGRFSGSSPKYFAHPRASLRTPSDTATLRTNAFVFSSCLRFVFIFTFSDFCAFCVEVSLKLRAFVEDWVKDPTALILFTHGDRDFAFMCGAFDGRDFRACFAEDAVALFTGFKGASCAVSEGVAPVSFF